MNLKYLFEKKLNVLKEFYETSKVPFDQIINDAQVGYISGVGCCWRIAEMQLEIVRNHIEKLEKQMDDLEARTE